MSLTKREKMMNQIAKVIEEAGVTFECDGYQNEQDSDLTLSKWSLDDADAVVNEILGIVADYIQDVL